MGPYSTGQSLKLTFNISAGLQRRGSVPVAPRFLGKSSEKRTRATAWTSKAELQVAAAQLQGMPTDKRAAGELGNIYFFSFTTEELRKIILEEAVKTQHTAVCNY